MIYLHPRRLLKYSVIALRSVCFAFQCKFHHVKFYVGNNTSLYRCKVASKGKGIIIIGDNCIIRNCTFGFYGLSGTIYIGSGTKINARHDARTGLYVKDGTTITIGERSLISNSVEIATTDWHKIVDEEGNMLNVNRDVYIGQHVWICRRVLIGKGVTLGNGSVVGAGSVVTKPFLDKEVLIAGNPAQIRKKNILWK